MEPEKHVANLLAGFGSFKFIPMPITISTNNFNPKLILYADSIEFRGGFTTKKLAYSEIERIDVFFAGKKTNNLWISKITGQTTFAGNFRKRSQLREFLQLFLDKRCALTKKALLELDAISNEV